MTSVFMLLALQVPLVGNDSYAEARQLTLDSGRPLIVFVGTDRCPTAIRVRQRILPELRLRHRRLLERVAFAVVDLSRDDRLGRQLVRDGPVPQLIMFRRTPEGWRCRRLIEVDDIEVVRTFIEQGLALDDQSRLARTVHPSRRAGQLVELEESAVPEEQEGEGQEGAEAEQ